VENKVILIVEDDPRDEALAVRALKKCNIINEVVVTRDGVEALNYLFGEGSFAGRDTRVMPQFVLLDLKLPRMDGLQVLRRIRSDDRTRRLPVVVFTCSTEEEDLIKSYNLGANSYVRKPVEYGAFLEAARQLGLYWLALNQVARILIVDKHEIVRDGVKRILDGQPGMTSFGEAGSTSEALKLVRDQEWDIALLDPSLGGLGDFEILKEIKEIRPHVPLLVLSAHSEEQFARRAFKAGASGYLTKDSSRAELVKAIYKVIEGGRYVSPDLAEKLVLDIEKYADRPPHETLSDREFEVMCLIASGKTVGQIAEHLALSDKTISTYRARILTKMGMKTNAELTRYAIRNGLVD
jgi:two-component system invasion response regulator UvrY